jgi:hypothetical protein
MNKEKKINIWKRKYPTGKALLSWDLSDYLSWEEEPPPCVTSGVTEGCALAEECIEQWAREEYHTLCILRDEYPKRFKEQYDNFVLDLEYLHSLGKISKEDVESLKKEENISFG